MLLNAVWRTYMRPSTTNMCRFICRLPEQVEDGRISASVVQIDIRWNE